MAAAVLLVSAAATTAGASASPVISATQATPATIKITHTIPVGRLPFAVAVNPQTNTIYVANFDGGNVAVISGQTNTVVTTVSVPLNPDAIGINPQTNTIYVTNAGNNTVSVINGQTNTVVTTVPVGALPSGVAVNPQTNTIYVANFGDNTLSVISGQANTVVTTVAGLGTPNGIAVNAGRQYRLRSQRRREHRVGARPLTQARSRIQINRPVYGKHDRDCKPSGPCTMTGSTPRQPFRLRGNSRFSRRNGTFCPELAPSDRSKPRTERRY